MTTIDLKRHVIARTGAWAKTGAKTGTFRSDLLELDHPTDTVTLVGPARVRVSVRARNEFTLLGTAQVVPQLKEVFGYTLDIPPGQSWTYPPPEAMLGEAKKTVEHVVEAPETALGLKETKELEAAIEARAAEVAAKEAARKAAFGARLPGTNAGYVVSIRPAGDAGCDDPCGAEPAKPKSCACDCSPCKCKHAEGDIPCDFAVANTPDAGAFFPAACEPCTPGAPVGMPSARGPALIVPPARGGSLRTRYFNGMFITREDLETDQRNVRLKRSMMNRAMGQGVVWGLDVCRDGESICVLPGYGVDCCGNDIVISTPYRVDGDALIRDPAAAGVLSHRGPHRMHLVLEYYECPEQPRPVHGDPCATESTRCEMGRIRETARLRLVPPRDVDDSGPIKDFLGELGKLKQEVHGYFPVDRDVLHGDRERPRRDDRGFPCMSEACDPSGAPRFPTTLPWLHADATDKGHAGDPKAIVLGILRMWLDGEMVRGTAPMGAEAVVPERAKLAAAIHRAAWLGLFSKDPDKEGREATSALRKMLQTFCRSFLYRGPTCGCEPHGVVIGCVRVEGGEIIGVDPWGGRRWVMHYPLVAHWGQQLGVAPPDATASKLFDMICCLGSLPEAAAPQTSELTKGGPGFAYVPLNGGILAFGDVSKYTSGHIEIVDRVPVDPLELVSRVTHALRSAEDPASLGGGVIDYVMTGEPELHFLVPTTRRPTRPVEQTPATTGAVMLGVPVMIVPAAKPAPKPQELEPRPHDPTPEPTDERTEVTFWLTDVDTSELEQFTDEQVESMLAKAKELATHVHPLGTPVALDAQSLRDELASLEGGEGVRYEYPLVIIQRTSDSEKDQLVGKALRTHLSVIPIGEVRRSHSSSAAAPYRALIFRLIRRG